MVQAFNIKITRTLPTFTIIKLTLESPCGGTVKHLVACESLQMVSGQIITSSYEMFNWCKENISGISFIYVSAEDVEKHSVLIRVQKKSKV